MHSPRIALCTTCKGRSHHLKLTLPRNLADNSDYDNCVFVVLDYGSDDDLIHYLKDRHATDISSGRLVVYSKANDGPFKMAHAKNAASRLGIREGAEIVVNIDADNFTGVGFVRYVAREFERIGDRGFLAARMVKGFMPRGINGRIALTSKAFLKAGGYDERFENWGPDDKDLNIRLQRLGYVYFDIPVQFLDGHRHSDRVRFREYPHARPATEEYEMPLEVNESVVNFGRIGCATVWRNFDESRPIELRPIPTRVWGIGLHKTGTASLCEALTLLGLDSAHWESPARARMIWEQVRADGRSEILDRCYAATDLPLPLLFRELDRAYPGSKFILTMRDEESWLRSVERHWDPAFNRFRSTWDEDCFTHRVHQELYGRRSFDRDVFRARYWRHNAEVLAYFKDRPGDLLVLDAQQKLKWPSLCGFLGLPVPTCEYPQANGTAAQSLCGDGSSQ